ncbi:hypothetical protein N7481_001280 [Penicillium waksmanii]|uniref:uncharacterized protein n=1 Tax=Penicillium waksmanii TaxID=69791 RepID=UPI0025496F6B|nr:uncharacterized protein N7481_001280 [Penicillium waksmanii]KAJ6000871.1 hypothetical protein N7481_001280 [Penicillium waksmanii]
MEDLKCKTRYCHSVISQDFALEKSLDAVVGSYLNGVLKITVGLCPKVLGNSLADLFMTVPSCNV